MQATWLKTSSALSSHLIVIVTGWTGHPLMFSPQTLSLFPDADILCLHGYRGSLLAVKEAHQYTKIIVIGWSFGILLSEHLCKQNLENILTPSSRHTFIAVNGTPYPVHKDLGILPVALNLTLRHARRHGISLFLDKLFSSPASHDLNPAEEEIRRLLQVHYQDLQSREEAICELESLIHLGENSSLTPQLSWSYALISSGDEIFPPDAQHLYWETQSKTSILELAPHTPHFPFHDPILGELVSTVLQS